MGQPTKGTKQFGGEIDEALADQWRAFCAERKESHRGENARYHLELALRRHMANPPDPIPEPPPLPPVTPAATTRKRGRQPKPKGGGK
jgi:hypothetical protein